MKRAVLLLAACGRIDFNPVAGGGAGDGGATNDVLVVSDAPTSMLGCVATGPEVCDGIDNDCNGLTDEGCPCTPFDQTLAIAKVPITPSGFEVVWTGSKYVVLIGRTGALTVMTVDATGVASAEQTLVAASFELAYPHEVAWNGHVLAFGYVAGTNATIALYDPTSNALVGTPITLTQTITAQEVRVRWMGDRFVAMWTDHTTFAKREISPAGTLMTPETIVTTIANEQLQSFAITPTGYLMCVEPPQSANTALYVVDATGAAAATNLTFGLGFGCQIDPGPGAYFVSVAQAISQDAPFTLIDASAKVLGGGKLQLIAQPGEYTSIAPIPTGTGYWMAATYVPDQTMLAKQVVTYETDVVGNVVAGPTPFTGFSTGASRIGVGIATEGRHAFAVLYDLAPQGMNPSHLYIGQHCP